MIKMTKNPVYIVLSIVALVLFTLMNYIKGWSFDIDETFSLAMIQHSFSEICVITARDFHPPLSYFILKISSWIIDPLFGGHLFAYRQTAVLGYFITFLLCIFPIRRLWGFKVSVIAMLLFMLMPMTFYIYSNFRMYAWTMPIVLGVFIYACDAYRNNDKWSWIKLTLFSLAAMYIHYYALTSTFVTYVLLMILVFAKWKATKDQTILRNYLISGVVLILLYLPWLFFFVGQLATVKEDYWIGRPALSDITFALQYYFVPKYYTEKYTNLLDNKWLLAVVPLLLAMVFGIFVLVFRKVNKLAESSKAGVKASALAIGILAISLTLIMIYTFVVSPVYHIRYLMCYFGLFILALSICLNVIQEEYKVGKYLVLAFAILLLVDFGLCITFNVRRSNFPSQKWSELEKQFDNLGKAFYSDEGAFPDMVYMTVMYPNNQYYLVTDDNPATREIKDPYIENDTITGMPYTNFKKIKRLGEIDTDFYYMTPTDPENNPKLKNYKVIDSPSRDLYLMSPLR